jgi:hypothetical protein
MPEIIIRDTKAMDFEEVRRGRVHMIRRKRLPLETGIPGVTMEYSLSVVPDGYFTPRHRHNFDQIRYTLSGVQSTGLAPITARRSSRANASAWCCSSRAPAASICSATRR